MGTFMLVFTVGCNVQSVNLDPKAQGVFVAVSIAASLMICIYALGPISGAHFNPAVTLGVCMAGKLDYGTGLLYWCSQVFAGVIAASAFYELYGGGIPFTGAAGNAKFSWYQVLTVEFLYTFMLVFTVLSTACCTKGNQYFGISIGFVIIAGGNAAGWISGGAFNPAVGIGLDFSDWNSGFGWSMPYNMAQLFGGAAAAGAFRFTRAHEYGLEWANEPSMRLRMNMACEFIGTFFLVLTVGLNVLKGGVMDPEDPLNEAAVFSIAASLLCMVYSVGPVSGAHLNPAVTLAVCASGRNKCKAYPDGACYVGAQVAGGLLASAFYVNIANMHAFDLGPYGMFHWSGVVVAEMVYTCLLCYVVLAVATVKDYGMDTFGLAIGFAIVAGGYSIGAVSGANLNPAVSVAIDVSYGLLHGGIWRFIPYAIIQCVGAAIAASIFRVTHPGEYAEELNAEGFQRQVDEKQDVEMQAKPEEIKAAAGGK